MAKIQTPHTTHQTPNTKQHMLQSEYNKLYEMCTDFAQKQLVTSRSKYRQRNQTNQVRITQQIADGKMGELFAARHLRKQGYVCSDPDFEIYTARNKSFDADLVVELADPFESRAVHVKTQNNESARRWGSSWVFQAGGAGYGNTDPLLDRTTNDWVVFVKLDAQAHSAVVIGPLEMAQVKQHLKDPVLERLKGIKKCIYESDLNEIQVQHAPTPTPTPTPAPEPTNTIEQLRALLELWMDSDFEHECHANASLTACGLRHGWLVDTEAVYYKPKVMLRTMMGSLPIVCENISVVQPTDWRGSESESESESESAGTNTNARKKKRKH
jgi:hypothetical protein